jgi:hypothetical protein
MLIHFTLNSAGQVRYNAIYTGGAAWFAPALSQKKHEPNGPDPTMSSLIHALTIAWRYRGRLLLCLLALPLLAYLYSQNKVESYTATTTLYINPNLVSSPLLQDMTPNAHRAILARRLAASDVLEHSLEQTGLLLPGADEATRTASLRQLQGQLRLNVLSEHIVQVKLDSTERATVLPLLENVSFNFRDALLAPEKYSNDTELNALADKVKQLETKLTALETDPNQSANPTTVVEMKNALAQAQKDYANQRRKAQLGNASAALKILEAPTLVAHPVTPTFDLLLSAAALGLFLGLLLVWLSHSLDNTLRGDSEIMKTLHLKVLGRMPDFGKLHIVNGRQTT